MANASVNLAYEPVGSGGIEIRKSVDGGSHIYEGTLVSQLTATGMCVPGSTASSGRAIGVAMHESDNSAGSDGDTILAMMSDRIFLFANGTSTDAFSDASLIGATAYMIDDHTVADNDSSASRQIAGIFYGMDPSGKVRVKVAAY